MPKWWNARSRSLALLGLTPHYQHPDFRLHLKGWGSGGAQHGVALPVVRRACGIPLRSCGVAVVVLHPLGVFRLCMRLRAVQGEHLLS